MLVTVSSLSDFKREMYAEGLIVHFLHLCIFLLPLLLFIFNQRSVSCFIDEMLRYTQQDKGRCC